MKKITVSILIFITAFSIACLLVMYLRKESNPVLFCVNPDGNIRPRTYCLLNPFRDKQAEKVAEEILTKLRNGETETLLPYLSQLNEDNKNQILEDERKFQIKSWRIGRLEETGDEFSLKYWTLRQNYEWEEEVNFYFVRENGEWKLESFDAIY
jgi:hypothetical protein